MYLTICRLVEYVYVYIYRHPRELHVSRAIFIVIWYNRARNKKLLVAREAEGRLIHREQLRRSRASTLFVFFIPPTHPSPAHTLFRTPFFHPSPQLPSSFTQHGEALFLCPWVFHHLLILHPSTSPSNIRVRFSQSRALESSEISVFLFFFFSFLCFVHQSLRINSCEGLTSLPNAIIRKIDKIGKFISVIIVRRGKNKKGKWD